MKGVFSKIKLNIVFAMMLIIIVFSFGNVFAANGRVVVLSDGETYRIDSSELTKTATGEYIFKFTIPDMASGTYEVLVDGKAFKNISTNAVEYLDDDGYLAGSHASGESGTSYQYRPLIDSAIYTITSSKKISSIVITKEHNSIAGGLASDVATTSSGKSLFESIETIIAKIIMSVAKVLNWMVSAAIKETLTIDDIVFNQYSETSLSFWDKDISASKKSSIVELLRDPVNKWYAIFSDIAVAGYMIILVYVGIKVLLQSTAAGKKANYKNTLLYWVTGLAILFFMPYYMKYVVRLNDAFVNQVAEARTEEAKSAKRAALDISAGYANTDFDEVVKFDTGSDYMSVVGALAERTGKLGIALAYMIMIWQLVVMLVYYFKRVFTIAFLIVIFPLVALTFVWDKLNDGKSQALSAWIQEFTVGVFVQSFHAIVLVFVVNTIYATLTTTSADFILLMIAASFLFAGEEILKQIFGASKIVATGNLAQTGTRVAVLATLGTSLAKRAVTNVAGAKGMVRQTTNAITQYNKAAVLTKKDANGVSNFEKMASRKSTKVNVSTMLPSIDVTTYPPEIIREAEVVSKLNNISKLSAQEMSIVLQNYEELSKMRATMDPNMAVAYDQVMSHCKLTPAQLQTLTMATTTAAAMASSGVEKRVIKQHLRVEAELAFPPEAGVPNPLANRAYQASLMRMRDHGASRGFTQGDVNKTWNASRNKISQFNSNVHLAQASKDAVLNERKNTNIENRKQGLLGQYQKAGGVISQESKNEIEQGARSIAVVEQLPNNNITAYEAYSAVSYLEDNRDITTRLIRHSSVDMDIDTLRYVVAKKITTEHQAEPNVSAGEVEKRQFNEAKKWANKTVQTMEADAAKMQASSRVVIPDAPASSADMSAKTAKNASRDITPVIDPYQQILGIIAAAKGEDGTAPVADLNSLVKNSEANTEGGKKVIEGMTEKIRSSNQNDIIAGMEFAKEALKEETIDRIPLEELQYNGMTYEEVEQLKDISLRKIAGGLGRAATDVAGETLLGTAGFAAGVATTDDGLPIAEAATGVMGGMAAAAGFADKQAADAFGDTKADADKKKLEEAVSKKLKETKSEDEKITASNAYAQATKASRDTRENTIIISGFRANMYIDSSDNLCATVTLMAENAEYMSVSENPVMPSGKWDAYQENVNIIFSDKDPKKSHDLYAYVKDKHGNVKGARLTNISM